MWLLLDGIVTRLSSVKKACYSYSDYQRYKLSAFNDIFVRKVKPVRKAEENGDGMQSVASSEKYTFEC